jgi:Restriction endonuclease
VTDPREIGPAALEILVVRELRRAGIEAGGLRRTISAKASGAAPAAFDLSGRLEAYGRKWSALVECRTSAPVGPADVDALRGRADAVPAKSALLFATSGFTNDAVRRADELRVALFRVVDAQSALLAQGLIEAGPLPAWVPEFTVELVALDGGDVRARLLEADQPEQVLRRLRPPVSG